MFADDTKFYYVHPHHDGTAITKRLTLFFFVVWHMAIVNSFPKMYFHSFGNPNIPALLCSIDNVPLQSANSICDLGVHISSDLKPHIHCSHIAAKAFGRCSVLLKGFISNDHQLLVMVHKVYVRPMLEYNYNSHVWESLINL